MTASPDPWPTAIARAATAGSLVWWLNATLAGTAAPDDAADHLQGRVAAPGGAAETPWPMALADLRRPGRAPLRLHLCEPGDPLGLPGPAAVTQLAVVAGVAVTTADGSLTFVPDPQLLGWRAWPSTTQATAAHPWHSLRDARSAMRTAMATITASFAGLDPDDAALGAITALRRFAPPTPPPGVDVAAAALAGDALRVWWLTGIADDLITRQGRPRPAELRELRPLGRRAAAAAFSEPAVPR